MRNIEGKKLCRKRKKGERERRKEGSTESKTESVKTKQGMHEKERKKESRGMLNTRYGEANWFNVYF